jgi:hypothetical protein
MLQILKFLTLWTLPLCTLIAVLMPPLGTRLPPPDRGIFEVCRLPCFGGITAGTTATGSVFMRMQAVFGANIALDVIGSPPGESSNISFTLNDGEQTYQGMVIGGATVGTIDLRGSIPLIVLLDQLGTPTCIMLTDPIENVSTFMVIQWENGEGIQSAYLTVGQTWDAFTTVEQLRLSDGGRGCSGGRLILRDWAGLRLLWRLYMGN